MSKNHPHHKTCVVSLCVQEAALGGMSSSERLATGGFHKRQQVFTENTVGLGDKGSCTGRLFCILIVGEGWAPVKSPNCPPRDKRDEGRERPDVPG